MFSVFEFQHFLMFTERVNPKQQFPPKHFFEGVDIFVLCGYNSWVFVINSLERIFYFVSEKRLCLVKCLNSVP